MQPRRQQLVVAGSSWQQGFEMQGLRVTRSRMIRSGGSFLVGGALAACGSATGSSSATSGAAATSAPVATPTARNVTLQIDNNWTSPPDRLTIVQAWLARANRVYPNVKTELTDLAGRPDSRAAAFASNTYGELFMGDLSVNSAQNSTIYEDIDPTLKTLKFDLSNIYDVPLFTQYEGKRYGTLIQLNSWVWVYNKTLFQQNGVPEPTAQWTWNDHLDAAKRLAKPDSGVWGMQVVGDNPFQWFWQAGADYVAKDGKSSLFTTDDCAKVVQPRGADLLGEHDPGAQVHQRRDGDGPALSSRPPAEHADQQPV